MKRASLLFLVPTFFLAACGSIEEPRIDFIGMSEGTMQTTLEQLAFTTRFEVDQRDLIGVISLGNVEDGTKVEATWFSPDDRSVPIGRTLIETQSGATIARFTFSSTIDWEPAPYMLQVRVMNGEGEDRKITTENLHFYIGLSDAEVQAYQEDWAEHERREAEESQAVEVEGEQELALATQASTLFGAKALLAYTAKKELPEDSLYVFIDTTDQPSFTTPDTPNLLVDATVHQFAVLTGAGEEVVVLREAGRVREIRNATGRLATIDADEGVGLTMLPTGTWALRWQQGRQVCSQEIRQIDKGVQLSEVSCF